MTEEHNIVVDAEKQMEWNFEYVKMLLAAVVTKYADGAALIDNSALHKSYDIQLSPYFAEDRTGLKVVVNEMKSGDDEGLD